MNTLNVHEAKTQLSAVDRLQPHRDPCDRLIIATARRHHWPIVTQASSRSDCGVPPWVMQV